MLRRVVMFGMMVMLSSVVMLGMMVMLRMLVMLRRVVMLGSDGDSEWCGDAWGDGNVEGGDVEEGSALEIMVLLRRVLKLGMMVMLK